MNASFNLLRKNNTIQFSSFPLRIDKHTIENRSNSFSVFFILIVFIFMFFESSNQINFLSAEQFKFTIFFMIFVLFLYNQYKLKSSTEYFEITSENIKLIDKKKPNKPLWIEDLKNYSGIALKESYWVSGGKNKRTYHLSEVFLVHSSKPQKNVCLFSSSEDTLPRNISETAAKKLNLPIIEWVAAKTPRILRKVEELDSKLIDSKAIAPNEKCPEDYFIFEKNNSGYHIKRNIYKLGLKKKTIFTAFIVVAILFIFLNETKTNISIKSFLNIETGVIISIFVLFFIISNMSNKLLINKNAISLKQNMTPNNSISFNDIEEITVKEIKHLHSSKSYYVLYIQSDHATIKFGAKAPQKALNWLAQKITFSITSQKNI